MKDDAARPGPPGEDLADAPGTGREAGAQSPGPQSAGSQSGRRAALVVCLCLLLWTAALGLLREGNAWIATGVPAVVVLLLCGALGREVLRPLWHGGWRLAAWGLGLGLLMAALTELLYLPARQVVPGLAAEVGRLYGRLHDPPGPLLALPVLGLVVLAEEVLFRGLVLSLLLRRLGDGGRGRAAAVLLGALVYALPQVASGSPLLFAMALGCGLCWGAERVAFRSLMVPLLTHLVWDGLVFLVFPLA